MKIYRFISSEDYAIVKVVSKGMHLLTFDRLFVKESHRKWSEKIRLGIVEEDSKPNKLVGDFPYYAGYQPIVVSQRAVDKIGDVLNDNGALYQVEIEGHNEPFYYYAVTNIVDCLNQEKSTLKSVNSPSVNYINVTKPAFFKKRIGSNSIFVLPEHPDGPIYVTEVFANILKESNLEGYDLIPEHRGA